MKWVPAVADAATILVALVVLAVVGMRFVGGGVLGPPPTDVKLDAESGIDFSRVERTLVAVLQSDCTFCAQSRPFYEQLGRRERDGVQIVIVAPPNDTGIDSYRSLLAPDDLVFVRPGVLPVSSTPTLLLVARDGTVEATWIGLLSPEREAEVLTLVFG